MDVSDRIKEVRKSLKLTQQQFAKELGTSHGFISEIEHGIKKPGYDLMMSLKRIFKISIDWLLTGDGKMIGNEIRAASELKIQYNTKTQVGSNDLIKENEKLKIGLSKAQAQIEVLEKVIKDAMRGEKKKPTAEILERAEASKGFTSS
jgi:transcriptional regulator with XRE-family HTH domain